MEDVEEEAPRIPVTVLTGVLGAGKTTLLKYILEKPHGYRVAVIQNEFSSEMGIEGPLIMDANGANFKDIFELPNGCLCCSAKDGLVDTLDRLLEVRGRFDYVLVEATGVADPESICEIFWVDEGLGSRVYLDGVVAVVDTKNVLSMLGGDCSMAEDGGASGLGLESEATKQVACADVLVLNKLDLVSEESKKKTAQVVAQINPTARLLESTFAVVPLGEILGIQAFDRGRLETSLASLEAPHGSHGDHGHGHSHDGGGHCAECGDPQVLTTHHGVQSLLLRSGANALYDPRKVRSWLAEVLWDGTAGFVYRCKGLFKGPPEEDDSEEPLPAEVAHALQGVGKLFEIDYAAGVVVAESKLLFVGRGLKREVLEAGLAKCRL